MGERLAVVEIEVKTVKETVNEIKETQSKNHAEVQEAQSRNHNDLVNQLSIMQDTFHKKWENHEQRIKTAEETILPLDKFRRNMWSKVVYVSLVAAVVVIVAVQTRKVNLVDLLGA